MFAKVLPMKESTISSDEMSDQTSLRADISADLPCQVILQRKCQFVMARRDLNGRTRRKLPIRKIGNSFHYKLLCPGQYRSTTLGNFPRYCAAASFQCELESVDSFVLADYIIGD